MIVDKIDRRSKRAHPLLSTQFPFLVKIMVQGKQGKPTFKGNDMFVPLSKGEVYEIWVENLSGRLTLMRCLVDGLNTLPQKEQLKGVTTYQVAKRVNLSEARAWVLDPKQSKIFAVRGFVTEVGPQGQLREFKVVDDQDSLAARQQFTDQIGLITIAFYAPKGDSRGGTAFGKKRQEDIGLYKGTGCGNLLGVVHIRYVEPEVLDQVGR